MSTKSTALHFPELHINQPLHYIFICMQSNSISDFFPYFLTFYSLNPTPSFPCLVYFGVKFVLITIFYLTKMHIDHRIENGVNIFLINSHESICPNLTGLTHIPSWMNCTQWKLKCTVQTQEKQFTIATSIHWKQSRKSICCTYFCLACWMQSISLN